MARVLWVGLQEEGEVALHRAAKAAAAAQGVPLRQWILRAMAARLAVVGADDRDVHEGGEAGVHVEPIEA